VKGLKLRKRGRTWPLSRVARYSKGPQKGREIDQELKDKISGEDLGSSIAKMI